MRHAALTIAVVAIVALAGCDPAEPEKQLPISTSLPATAEATLKPSSTPRITPTIGHPPTMTTTPSPEVQVLLAWIDAFNRQDVDAFMSYIAQDTTLDRGPHGIVTGADAIRETILREFEDSLRARVTWWSVEGNTITYGSYVLAGGTRIDSCTSLMIVEDGKIVSDQCAP